MSIAIGHQTDFKLSVYIGFLKILPYPDTLTPSVAAKDWFTSPNVEVFSLAENRYARWGTAEREASFTVADSTDLTPQRPILRSVFAIDHENEGQYPIGWPAVLANIPNNVAILSDYDFVHFKVKVNSNRSETEDANTPVRIYSRNYGSTLNNDGNVMIDLGNIQRQWISMTVPISDMFGNADSRSDRRAFLQTVRFHLFESDYKHGTRMELDFADVSLLRSKFPSVERIIAPNLIRQGEKWLGASIEMLGKCSADYTLTVKLVDANDIVATEVQKTLSEERSYRVNLDASHVKSGMYLLRVSISDKNGAVLSESERNVEMAERD